MTKYLFCIVAAILLYMPTASASESGLHVVLKKVYSGHLIFNTKGGVSFYRESGRNGQKFDKITLEIKGDSIYRKNSEAISRADYWRQLDADMNLLQSIADKVPNVGDKAELHIPLTGINDHYLLATVWRSSDLSMTTYIGPCRGHSMLKLEGEIPKSVRLLSREGNDTKAVVIEVSCGNNDCVSELEFVKGPLDTCLRGGK